MKEKRENSSSPAARLLHSLQLPDDFVKGNTLVTMHGQERVWIENFKGISSYSPEEICLLTRNKNILVTGKRLEIVSYTRDEIEIGGSIHSVSFLAKAGPRGENRR